MNDLNGCIVASAAPSVIGQRDTIAEIGALLDRALELADDVGEHLLAAHVSLSRQTVRTLSSLP